MVMCGDRSYQCAQSYALSLGGGASRIGLVPSRHFRCDHVCKLLLSVCLSTGMPPTGRLTTTRNTHSSAALRQHPLPVQGVAFATPAPAMSTAVDVPAAAPEGQPVVAASAAASNCGGEDCWLSDQSQDPGENQSSVIQPGHSPGTFPAFRPQDPGESQIFAMQPSHSPGASCLQDLAVAAAEPSPGVAAEIPTREQIEADLARAIGLRSQLETQLALASTEVTVLRGLLRQRKRADMLDKYHAPPDLLLTPPDDPVPDTQQATPCRDPGPAGPSVIKRARAEQKPADQCRACWNESRGRRPAAAHSRGAGGSMCRLSTRARRDAGSYGKPAAAD